MNNKIKRFLATLFIFILLGFAVNAQDAIHKTNGDIIECKVKEVGSDEVKYNLPDYPEDLLFTIDNDKIQKIVFENGQVIEIKDQMTDPENYLDNKKNAIKVDFLSPLTGNTTLSYERSLKPGRSLEASLGFIGLGKNVDDAAGAFAKFGVKYIKSPDFYLRGMRYAHLLKGSYILPEFSLGYYSIKRYHYEYVYPYGGYSSTSRDRVVTGALVINFGKQWVFDNEFLVDIYLGAGYGFDSDNYDQGYHFNFSTPGDEELPLAFTAGMKIGFLFGD